MLLWRVAAQACAPAWLVACNGGVDGNSRAPSRSEALVQPAELVHQGKLRGLPSMMGR